MSEDSFLQALFDDPEDNDARSVYADWLEEQGDSKAEYLRLELQLREVQQQMLEVQRLLDPSWLQQARRSLIDLDAPIIPGHSAAGIFLNEPIEAVMAIAPFNDTDEFGDSHRRYRFGSLNLWVEQGLITQIAVSFGYRGQVEGGIGVGSRIADVEAGFGRVTSGEIGSLVVDSLPGLCFSVEGHLVTAPTSSELPNARIDSLYVFHPEDV